MFPRSILYLLTVAEHQSFTRAAEALYVSQPTLSQQIKQLEDALGVQLLDRSGRTVQLTAAGEAYLTFARRALEELKAGRRAVSEVEDLSRGFLRLGMTPITEYLTTSLLNAFCTRYPGIIVNAMEMPRDHIETGIIDNTLDIGIAFTHMPSTEVMSSRIEMRTMFMESLSLAIGSTHPLAGQRGPLSIHVLEQKPLVLLSPVFGLRRHIDLYCLENGITLHIAVETNSPSVLVQSVNLGRFATILPNTMARQAGLRTVPLLPDLPHHTVALLCSNGAYKSPACRAFGNLAANWNFD
ncbi:MAG: transcriptional regulator CynR [Gallionellaceae bacterium]|nr:transcriptional regulator CynR [Gallionellaceae bacterium]